MLAVTWFGLQPTTNSTSALLEIQASRRAIVDAFEIERRRIERDLHDGAQQFLVASAMKVGEAELMLQMAGAQPESSAELVSQASKLLRESQDTTEEALVALRRTVRGVHLQVLVDRGLEAAVRDVAARSANPVTVHVPHSLPSLPPGVEAAGFYVVSEALTNAHKYAPGAPVSILLTVDTHLRISVVDEGPGGARPTNHGGLSGLVQRLETFGGHLRIVSPIGGPTQILAEIPLLVDQGQATIAADLAVWANPDLH
ncbi:hypothetical protein BK816_00805 [Boudabousia tangfeifanii]|uniref:histidine kinase n=1 Tax=Boudabousia tangfeifanii TaxID=1912795 RepID=A0A1D9MMM7_9ACTO|nr:hypothetical protein BK816_00805 [Boudabousia tangfeifanii]